MPIEIKELVVRATIVSGDNKKMSRSQSMTDEKGSDDRKMIVQECVDQVMQILKDKNER